MTDRDVLDRLEDLRHSLYGATIEAAIAEIERIRFDYSTSRQMIDELIRESARLRASPWVSVCEWQWHKLAERMVTACGNESDSVGAFCQFCGGKVEVV